MCRATREMRQAYHSPIDFEICEQDIIKRREHGQDMRVLVELPEVLAMLIHGSSFIPPRSNTWIVLPFVEEIEMISIGVVESNHREVLFQVWYPSAVDN
jgi:hypothetical protein